MLGQKREGRVDGRRVGLWVVVLITGQSVAHVVRCVWKLFIKASRMLQQIENCHTRSKTHILKMTQMTYQRGIKYNKSGSNWEKTGAI